MRRTLYRKLILIYVILAIAGFTLISTVGSRMVEDSLVSSASTSLYREATQIASKQGDLYYHSERSLTDLYNSLSALASYHNSQIWLISADGEILLNTAAALDEENPEISQQGIDPGFAVGQPFLRNVGFERPVFGFEALEGIVGQFGDQYFGLLILRKGNIQRYIVHIM